MSWLFLGSNDVLHKGSVRTLTLEHTEHEHDHWPKDDGITEYLE